MIHPGLLVPTTRHSFIPYPPASHPLISHFGEMKEELGTKVWTMSELLAFSSHFSLHYICLERQTGNASVDKVSVQRSSISIFVTCLFTHI